MKLRVEELSFRRTRRLIMGCCGSCSRMSGSYFQLHVQAGSQLADRRGSPTFVPSPSYSRGTCARWLYAFVLLLLGHLAHPHLARALARKTTQRGAIPRKISLDTPYEGEHAWSAAPAFRSHHDQTRRGRGWRAEDAIRAFWWHSTRSQTGRMCKG